MSRTKALKNVKLTSFDDLFGGKVVEETAETGDVKEIPLSELHEFHNHPFQIRSDEELEEMIESVREHGVLVPGIVRKREQGGYEIIAGHTRKHVCEVLGLETMPVFEELQKDIIKVAANKGDYDYIAKEIVSLREKKQELQMDHAQMEGVKERVSEMEKFLDEHVDKVTEYDERLVRALIEKITVYDDKVDVEFKSGTKTTVIR